MVRADGSGAHDSGVIHGRPQQLDACLHGLSGDVDDGSAIRAPAGRSRRCGPRVRSTCPRSAASSSAASRFRPRRSESSRPSVGTSVSTRMRCAPDTAWQRQPWPSRSIRRPLPGRRSGSTQKLLPQANGTRLPKAGSNSCRVVRLSPTRRCARTGRHALGELEIRSPSLLDGYVGDDASPLTSDGWLQTADLAHVRDGDVFIAGRTDDVLIVAGRNLDARALDALVEGHPACRPGNAACCLGRHRALRRRARAQHSGTGTRGAPGRCPRDTRSARPAVRRRTVRRGLH